MMKAIENLLRAPNHPFNLALQMFTTTFFGLKCYVIYWPKPRYCFLFRLYFDRFSFFIRKYKNCKFIRIDRRSSGVV